MLEGDSFAACEFERSENEQVEKPLNFRLSKGLKIKLIFYTI
jgi:hypothetical protein